MATSSNIHLNIGYISDSTLPGHTLDLYEPVRQEDDKTLFPLVVYIHGGGWTERDKQDYAHLGEVCITHNLSCAILNYRLSPLTVPEGSEEHLKHPTHTEDCAFAFSYLYTHASSYHYDVNNVIVIGHSAGGFMAALLQFEDRNRQIWIPNGKGLNLRHIIGLQGIYDLPSILSDFGQDYLTYMIAPAFGWDANAYKNASPTKIVAELSGSTGLEAKVAVPWTLIWSNKDTMVNLRQSAEFEASLKSINVQTSHLVLELESSDSSSHHGVTQKDGFSSHILPILLSIVKST